MAKAIPALVIHGGAGTISKEMMTPEKDRAYRKGLDEALEAGWQVLAQSGSALDAAQAAVIALENYPLFNAGKGAVFSHEGLNELDSSIMCGQRIEAGAVAAVQGVRNPIQLARAVLEHSEHVMLCGRGAEDFADVQQIERAAAEYFHTDERYQQFQHARAENKVVLDHTGEDNYGTVGAVAIDTDGNLAAATSTGGMTNKKFGRIGDSPIIGSGTWADNSTCGVSCTGHGEYFIRAVAAYDLHARMKYGVQDFDRAAEAVIEQGIGEPGGDGGLIAIDYRGRIAMPFNSPGMYRGYRRADAQATGIFEADLAHFV